MWTRIEEVFGEVLDAPETDRAAVLARACGEDAALRAEVEALLASTPRAGALLAATVASAAHDFAADRQEAALGRRIGPYRLVEVLGEGGMGVVYLAERDDGAFRREVAIKVLPHGLGSEAAIARFRDERQILAALDHPNIVRLLDGGTAEDGAPYLVMERIAGVPITAHAKARSIRDRVSLVRRICEALHYAHGRGVIHRDLKPSNLLVTADGTPKLLDFGIAKLVDAESALAREAKTRTGMALLTPEYASPEQARGEAVTPATDVYALGAVLYEVLAGEPPQRPRGGPLEVLHAICEVEPPRPSTLRRELAGDVDNIVMKALAKEPARRYASAAALADDLGRFLDGKPVLARTPTLGYRAGKLVRRHRGKLALAAAGLAIATAVAVVAWPREEVTGPECSTSTERLAGIWDPMVRARMATHFAQVDRLDVAATARRVQGDLDAFTSEWSRQWDAACVSSERQTDALLHAQRQSCLERTLVDLRGVVASLFASEPGSFAAAWNGTMFTWSTPLADCARTETLRAMPPAPPLEHRKEVAELVTQMHLSRAEVRAVINAGLAGDVVKANARIDRVVERLAVLGAAAAAEAAMVHAWYAYTMVIRDRSQLPAARRSWERSVALARKFGDDRVLGMTHDWGAEQEIDLTRGIELARTLVGRVREARERSGGSAALPDPSRAETYLAFQTHDWKAVLAAGPPSRAAPSANRDSLLWQAWTQLQFGRAEEAIAIARARVETSITDWGRDHWSPAQSFDELGQIAYQAGDFKQALSAAREALSIHDRIRSSLYRRWSPATLELLALARLGEPGLEAAATRFYEMQHASTKASTPLWLFIAMTARDRGNCDLASFALARVPPERDADSLLIAMHCDLFADLASIGRRVAAAHPYRVPTSLAEVNGPSAIAALTLAYVDARAGRTAQALDYLQRSRAAHTMKDPMGSFLARANDLGILMELGRWKEARATVDGFADFVREHQLGDGGAEGRVMLESGDPAGAVKFLETALQTAIRNNNNANLSLASFALARALWESGTDRARARRLAELATRTFTNSYEKERRAAQQWLATHPL